MKKYPHKFCQRSLEAEKYIDHKAKFDPDCLGYVVLNGDEYHWKSMRGGSVNFMLVE